ncbi:MAG: NF038122 family metalloprotease, partial [Acidobacteriota bacterium]|nr:NF038122 family metalloprotease [Acidobacteriota bacterium]
MRNARKVISHWFLAVLVLNALGPGLLAWGADRSARSHAVRASHFLISKTQDLIQHQDFTQHQDLTEHLTAHGEGGGFVIVQGEDGSATCREATPEELLQMRPDPNVPLHVITPLQASQQQTGLRIILRGTPQLEQFPQAKAAFLRAAQTWERLIQSPITVVIDVDFGPTRFGRPFSPRTIGSAITQEVGGSVYSGVRSQLLAGASSASETTIYTALPQGQVPTDLGATERILAPSAVFRALGLINPVADPDGERSRFGDPPSIGFNSNMPFDFNPNDGIDPDKLDFDATAVHEIGHVLGFTSLVGYRELDASSPVAVSVWDLFRFRPGVTQATFSTAQRILSSGGEQVFFAGPPALPLSTGRPDGSGGDGNQASHWKDDDLTGQYIGIMDPTARPGERNEITENDLKALDFFGYRVSAQTQPPPSGDVVDLTSGVPQQGSIPAPSQPGRGVLGETQYRIRVPAGATQLRVELRASGTQDVDLYVRFGQRVELQGGRVVADYISESPAGVETITVTPSSSPPLREGAYFIAVGNFGPGAATFTVTATVSGGAQPPPAQPDIDVQPMALDFGNVTVGSTADRTVTVRNVGNAPLTVTALSIDNPRFTVTSPSAPFTVSAGGQQTITVRFAPTAAGAQSGTLRIQSNDPDEGTVSVSLTGQGVAAPPPAPGRTLSVPNASGEPGRTVTIAVNLSEGSGISALSFTLSFNPSVLSVSGPSAVSRGSLVPDTFSVSPNTATAGQVRIVISPPLQTPLPTFRSGSGSVVTITFQVASGASSGATSPLALSDISASDPNAGSVPITPQNGTFTVGVARTLTVASVQGAAGSTVTIPITLSEGAGISALQFTLSFNSAILTPAANPVALGSLVPSAFTVSANTATTGQITVVISPPLTSPLPTFNSGSGTIVTLTFQVASGASPGATSPLALSNISASDRNANSVGITAQNGTFTVLAVRRGDINQDGVINVQDLILLIRHLTGESPLTGAALQAADVNGDGQVNVQDVVRLIQHLTGERPLSIRVPGEEETARWVALGERFW